MSFKQTAAPRGSESILLVETDPETRKLAAFMLGKRGYTVLEARNRTEALALVNERGGDVDLLLLETRAGCGLAEELKQSQPYLRVLFMCADTVRGAPFVVGKGSQFLKKPFTMWEIAGRVRETLDSSVETVMTAGTSF